MPEFIDFIWLTLAGFALFWFAEWLYYFQKVSTEVIRKIIHICAGLLSLMLPIYFTDQWWVLLLCSLFQLILVLSIQTGYLKSINAVKRISYGSVVYPMVVYLVYLAWFYSGSWQDQASQSHAYFNLPILIMALCKPLSVFWGVKYPIYKLKRLNRSIGGTLSFWIGAFLLSCLVLVTSHLFNNKDLFMVAFFIASIASFAQYYSKKGMDNLLIPITVLIGMYVAEYFF